MHIHHIEHVFKMMELGSSVVECQTRNRVSPGSNPPLLPFRRLGIFVLSIVVPVDSAVYMSTGISYDRVYITSSLDMMHHARPTQLFVIYYK